MKTLLLDKSKESFNSLSEKNKNIFNNKLFKDKIFFFREIEILNILKTNNLNIKIEMNSKEKF